MSKKSWWWLSFADPELPKGKQFLGVVVAPGDTFMQAHAHVTLARLNPGGEVKGCPIKAEGLSNFPPESRMRLLSTDDMERLWPGGVTTLAELEGS